eukprot:scaffold5045_cov71-Cyclotella_meneghiniana.AAC.5
MAAKVATIDRTDLTVGEHYQIIYPCPSITIVAIELMQVVKLLIASIDLRNVLQLQFCELQRWRASRQQRFCKTGGINLVLSYRIFCMESN